MSTPENRLRMAAQIFNFEARRDLSSGRLIVYYLPTGDGGGRYEVAGINERYHPSTAADLRRLVENGQQEEAELYARNYIASYTDTAERWTPFEAVEFYLRDCVFNRGPGGAAKIYQMALGVRVDGDVGPITRAAGASVRPAEFLQRLRRARERYEREVVGRDERSTFWKGLVNRWNNALAFAEQFLDLGGDGTIPAPELPVSEPRPGSLEIVTEEGFALLEEGLAGPLDVVIPADTQPAPDDQPNEPLQTEQPTFPEAPAPRAVVATPALNIRVAQPALHSRSRTTPPTLVVLHATAGASAQSSINHLRGVGLSYHYIIARDGRDSRRTTESDGSHPVIFHCVDNARTAFHVGSTIPAPSGQRINDASIGVSIANLQSGGERYTPGQIAALNALLAHLRQSHPSLRYLTTHALVQPWNRADPLGIDAAALAAAHGFTLFRPTAEQIRQHRPRP